MVIVFGTVTCGQADVVDKRFSVATEFFHILWVPLIPIGSLVVFDQNTPKKMLKKLREQRTPEPNAEADAEPAQTENNASADEELRISIPMSGKSVLLGYLRGWGFALALFCGFLGGMLWLMRADDPEAGAMASGFLYTALGAFCVAMGSYYGPWNTASPKRARKLCIAAGLDENILPEEMRQKLRDDE